MGSVSVAIYKRCKMGMLPGDLSKRSKIRMLEGDVPFTPFPWQIVDRAAAKSYRKDHCRKANRRWRHGAREAIENDT